MAKQQKNYYLPSEITNEIKTYAKENNLTESLVIERAWESFKNVEGENYELIANKFLSLFDEKYKSWLTGVRLGVRQSEMNSNIIIEILNTFAIKQNFDTCLTTDIHKNKVISGAQDVVKERLEKIKQKSDWRRKQVD